MGRAGAALIVAARLALLALMALAPIGCASSPAPPSQTGAAAPAPAASAPAVPAAPPGPPGGAMLRLFPPSEARPLLLASIALPSLDRTLAGAVALLSHAVPLPLDAAGVKEMLLTQAGLPPKVGENLDTASPAGAVVVATGGKDIAGLVMAIPAKGVEQARVVVAALGSVVARRGEVVQIDNGSGGRGWVWQSAGVIVLSDSVDALGRGAMLALEARRSVTGEDVTSVVYPEAVARAHGTDVKTALATVVAMARAARAAQALDAQSRAKPGGAGRAGAGAGTGPDGAGTDHSLDVLEDLAGYLGDANTIEIGLGIDEARGLNVSLRIHPKPGTPFEKLTTEGHPFTIDPALLRDTDDVAFAAASSYGPFLRAQITRQRRRLEESHDKGAAAALQFFDASIAALEGSWSGVGRLRPSLSIQAIYPLKDEANAARLTAAMAHVDTAAALAFLKSQLAPDQQRWFDLKLKKEAVGKLKALHYMLTVDAKTLPADKRDVMKKVLGAAALDVYVAVSGMRTLVTVGKDARAQLIALGRSGPAVGGGKPGDKSTSANADLADAIGAARGKDSFAYFDLGQIVSLVGALADEPRTKALASSATAPIPTYATFANDSQAKQITFTWTITPAAFVGAGSILQGGFSGGGGASP